MFTQRFITSLFFSLVLLSPQLSWASAVPNPEEARRFYHFISSLRKQSQDEGDELLRAEKAEDSKGNPVYRIRLLDRYGRVKVKLYDTESLELIEDLSFRHIDRGNDNDDRGDSGGGSSNGGSGGDDDDDDDDDD